MQTVIAPTRPGVATVAQKYFVDGMTCGHCTRAVRSAVRNLTGCTDVHVDLRAGVVVAESEAPLEIAAVSDAVTGAGYRLIPPADRRSAA